jgi:hypothetical protein
MKKSSTVAADLVDHLVVQLAERINLGAVLLLRGLP